MRFAVARQAGLTEERAGLVADGWEESALAPREKAALAFADAFLGPAGPMPSAVAARVAAHFEPAAVVELGVALALFLGFSKIQIALASAPVTMPTTVVPTPGCEDERTEDG